MVDELSFAAAGVPESEMRPVRQLGDLRRARTADDIGCMKNPGVWLGPSPAHAHSEGMGLRAPDLQSLENLLSLEKEILSSRSLFDPRAIPPSPEQVSLAEILSGPSAPHPPLSKRKILSLHAVRIIRIVQHYFVFLQLGIITALIWANVDADSYSRIWSSQVGTHSFSFHFFVNDIFMVFFFGIAMVHVTKALRPGGSLSPLKRALTPLLGTVGGVLGPAAFYLCLVAIQGNFATESSGWAVCIATDISVAWLVATIVFGSGTHPAVEFLLLLAVADDVIGLIVIAVAFPTGDIHLIWLLMVLGAIVVCAVFRWALKLEQWFFYVFIAGPLSWYGLYMAGVHPALALCVVVPFIPGDNVEKFDHNCSLIVHIGLFFFALCNAGVAFNEIGMVTLNVTVSLVVGKTLGIFLFTWLGIALGGLQLPDGMKKRHLALLAHVSGAGLTVALFVAELAFTDPIMRDQARLGALLTVIVAPSAICIEYLFSIKEKVSSAPQGKTPVADSV